MQIHLCLVARVVPIRMLTVQIWLLTLQISFPFGHRLRLVFSNRFIVQLDVLCDIVYCYHATETKVMLSKLWHSLSHVNSFDIQEALIC
uniref:Uncharacterized protein n=1 Tax=Arundo donax TaxID=35708 RepID=A0A0A8YSI5_ARUDO